MAYNDFTLPALTKQFGLHIQEGHDLFAQTQELAISDWLRETLAYQLPMAVSLSTEKARSELLISPILVEARRQLREKISVFSGIEFNVDIESGLRGVCDFLVSLSAVQLYVEAPVIAVVEAKNDNIKSGITQCAAEMLAVQRFNKSENVSLSSVFGAVTTGNHWRFLKLVGDTVYIDNVEYSIERVEKILGIIVSMLREASAGQVVREGKAFYSVL